MKDFSLSFLNRRDEWTPVVIEDPTDAVSVANAMKTADVVTCWSADIANQYRTKLNAIGFQHESSVVIKKTGVSGVRFSKIKPTIKVSLDAVFAAMK